MVKIDDRNTPRKNLLPCHLFFTLSPTMPFLGLNLSLREILMDNHLNGSAVAMGIFEYS
jgi:hypothetical protein